MMRKLLVLVTSLLVAMTSWGFLYSQDQVSQHLSEEQRRWDRNLTQHDQTVVRPALQRAVNQFIRSNDRPQFQAACEKLLVEYPTTGLRGVVQGLIDSLHREAQRPLTPALEIPEAQRTLEQRIECLVFEIRNLNVTPDSIPGQPHLLGWPHEGSFFPKNAYTQLFEIGPPAIPFLIAALEDDAPSLTTNWTGGISSRDCIIWRRQDIAMQCLEAITACRFFSSGWYRTQLHLDSPERRRAAINNVHKWRELTVGKSQVDSLRIQLELSRSNPTLRDHERLEMMETLGKLAGPGEVLAELREMQELSRKPQQPMPGVDLLLRESMGPRRRIQELVRAFDQPRYIQDVFRRFWENSLRDLEHYDVLKYGDLRTYEQIVLRLESPEKLDAKMWFNGTTIGITAENGREWSIPILAHLLTLSEINTTRHVGNETQQVSTADYAVGPFQELTGFDAGYRETLSPAERMNAITRAREWWLATGRQALQPKIAADRSRAEVVGDLLLIEEDRAALEIKLLSSNPEIRRRAVGNQTFVRFCTTRNALWQALRNETLPEERRRILNVLLASPVSWELEQPLDAFLRETDIETQLLAGKLLHEAWIGGRSWQLRLEARDAAKQRLQNYRLHQFLEGPALPAAVGDQIEKILKL